MMRFFLRLNITQKYLALLALISIVPVLLVGMFSYQVARSILSEQATR